MLVLSRKVGETFICHHPDGPITITINRVSGNRVTVGIDAPDTVPITRTELLQHPRSPVSEPLESHPLQT